MRWPAREASRAVRLDHIQKIYRFKQAVGTMADIGRPTAPGRQTCEDPKKNPALELGSNLSRVHVQGIETWSLRKQTSPMLDVKAPGRNHEVQLQREQPAGLLLFNSQAMTCSTRGILRYRELVIARRIPALPREAPISASSNMEAVTGSTRSPLSMACSPSERWAGRVFQ
jgi:hypothetical protein